MSLKRGFERRGSMRTTGPRWRRRARCRRICAPSNAGPGSATSGDRPLARIRPSTISALVPMSTRSRDPAVRSPAMRTFGQDDAPRRSGPDRHARRCQGSTWIRRARPRMRRRTSRAGRRAGRRGERKGAPRARVPGSGAESGWVHDRFADQRVISTRVTPRDPGPSGPSSVPAMSSKRRHRTARGFTLSRPPDYHHTERRGSSNLRPKRICGFMDPARGEHCRRSRESQNAPADRGPVRYPTSTPANRLVKDPGTGHDLLPCGAPRR